MGNGVSDGVNDDFITRAMSLIEQGESDKVVEMIRSLKDKKEAITTIRALVDAVTTMITQARDRAHAYARALDLDRERARDLDLDLARALSRDMELDRPELEPERALSSSLALTKAMTRANERSADLADALDRELAVDFGLNLARAYTDVINRLLSAED